MRDQRVPYISVDEAKKSLLPARTPLLARADDGAPRTLKNFDFVIYGSGSNLLIEVKGRRLPRVRLRDGTPAKPRMESWVTLDDIDALQRWRSLFGPEFEPMFVFMYWCEDVPPDGLFAETIAHKGRWYTMRCIDLDSYMGAMRVRSPKWRTVNLARADFEALSRPFSVPGSVLGAVPGRVSGWDGRDGSRGGCVREPVFEAMGALG